MKNLYPGDPRSYFSVYQDPQTTKILKYNNNEPACCYNGQYKLHEIIENDKTN